jgi:hypothetical protein
MITKKAIRGKATRNLDKMIVKLTKLKFDQVSGDVNNGKVTTPSKAKMLVTANANRYE